MNIEKDLHSFYSKELLPIIEPLEKFRQENAIRLKNRLWGAVFCLPVFFAGIFLEEPLIMFITILPSVYLLGYAYSIYSKMQKFLRFRFKNDVLSQVIGKLFVDFEYIARQKIAKHVLVKSLLFPGYIGGVRGEDFMKFRIGNSILMFCETMVYKSENKLTFNGIFISSSFNKYFNSKTLVISKKASNFLLRIKSQLANNMKKIDLENNEFARLFSVISNDQVDARYILSPGLMHRILDYKKKIKKNISLSFVENRMYCAVPKQYDLFEAPILEPLDFEWIKKSLEPIILYTDLVEDLNLNLRIWSKQ